MGQHRRKQHHRRMVIAAVAVAAVGVPSAALACTEWPYGGEGPTDTATAAATEVPVAQWQAATQRHHDRNAQPAATPTATPASASPEVTAPPRAKVTVHRTTATHPPKRTATPSAPRTTTATATAAPSIPQPTATAATTASASAPASGVAARIVQLVNAERAKAGCQDLTLDAKLTKAAQAHSADMAAHQNMSHTGSDGSDPGDRITAAGYTWSGYGENVAYGYSTAEQVMAGWMSSPGHRANILNCGFQEIGVGLAQPNSYWTQDFGTAR
ncbi:CAP domain-containing protein [Streptomyces sp. LP11]|uniref:CAP domain-containing protein n=1 Tax=Streptomyces pyxinicus TaxID=2970331 RepID=A0ABT2B5Q0_9ACTN|nr:CAP domain-containing protein [Streptomyces sp. LP11]MCS0603847.1 CAP domain-containing protein [Streptomyces sp. LP11]